MSDLDEVDIELRRVADRLDTMPPAKAESVVGRCHDVAVSIVDQTRAMTDEIPVDAVVPVVGISALGSQLTVLGADFVQAARLIPGADVRPVLDALIDLRRSLP